MEDLMEGAHRGTLDELAEWSEWADKMLVLKNDDQNQAGTMDKKTHWEDIYSKEKVDEVSWYQTQPSLSLHMIEAANLDRNAAIIDVGGGTSRLIDNLIMQGYTNLTVLDISEKSLERAKERIGSASQNIQWVESDIADFNPHQKFQFWHDRVVFHFFDSTRGSHSLS